MRLVKVINIGLLAAVCLAQIGGGGHGIGPINGGTGGPGGACSGLAGDVTGTCAANSVVKINGTTLSGLATGILKNTTSTGVPSIAVAGTDFAAPNASTTVNGQPCALGGSCTIPVVHSFGATFDGGTTALTSGKTVYFTVPYACTINAWNITAAPSGTATVDIWKIATGTAIPTIANTITASSLPALATGTAIHSSTLTGWTTSVTANDIIGVNLNAVATATYVNIQVQCQ